MKEDHTYAQDHRQQMEYELDRQDKEWKTLNRRQPSYRFDWLAVFVWSALFLICGIAFWLCMDMLGSLFR